MHGRWEFNPQIHDLLQQFSLHFAKVSSLSITKMKKNIYILRLYS